MSGSFDQGRERYYADMAEAIRRAQAKPGMVIVHAPASNIAPADRAMLRIQGLAAGALLAILADFAKQSGVSPMQIAAGAFFMVVGAVTLAIIGHGFWRACQWMLGR